MKLPLHLPKWKDLRGDLAAGLTNGLVPIPDAMASAILAGVGERMGDQLERTGLADLLGRDSIFPARSLVDGSTEAAYEAARLRLKAREAD